MKKLLGVSLISVLAVSPLMARAETEMPSAYALTNESGLSQSSMTPVATNGKYFAGKTVTDADRSNIATASYVKGSYNAAISAINKVASQIESDVETTLEDYATKPGVVATIDQATATGNVTVALPTITPAGTVSSTFSNGAFTGNVTLPNSVTAVTEWGHDDATTNIALNNSQTATQISGSVTGDVRSTFTGNAISGVNASGNNTLSVSVDNYYATAPATTPSTTPSTDNNEGN